MATKLYQHVLDFVFERAIKNKVVSYIKLLDLETNLDKWFYLLRNLHEFENRPLKLQSEILEKVLDIAEYAV